MGPADFALRPNLFKWFLHLCVEEPQFPRQILFTDEYRFTRNAVLNTRNSHVWDDGNTHFQDAHGFQQRFDINVWAGTVDGRLMGPYLLPPRIMGHTYLIFLQEALGELFEDVLLIHPSTPLVSTRWRTTHFAHAVRDHLNRCFGQRWIGRGGPITWPPRPPDLTPLGVFLWGHMKSLVY